MIATRLHGPSGCLRNFGNDLHDLIVWLVRHAEYRLIPIDFVAVHSRNGLQYGKPLLRVQQHIFELGLVCGAAGHREKAGAHGFVACGHVNVVANRPCRLRLPCCSLTRRIHLIV